MHHRDPSAHPGSDLGGQGAIPAGRDHPAPPSREKGWIPSQQLVPRAFPAALLEAGARIFHGCVSLCGSGVFLPPCQAWLCSLLRWMLGTKDPFVASLGKSGKQPEVKSLCSEVWERVIHLIQAGSGVQLEFKCTGITSRSPSVTKIPQKNHGKAIFPS